MVLMVEQDRGEHLIRRFAGRGNEPDPRDMEYLPKRRWTNQDKRRARVMINAIDKKLRDRRLMRSLEKFVGGRPYGEDLRLLQRTI
ncbi:hypothetical protein Tco_0854895 [Tanacetum coccineum]